MRCWWVWILAGVAGCGWGGGNGQAGGGIGGKALGAAGGYVVGVPGEGRKLNEGAAVDASKEAETRPVKAEEASNAATADVNGDGFVTLDEVIAMHDAGLSVGEQIARLKATADRFAVTRWQEQYLRDRGVEEAVVAAMSGD